MSLRLNLYEQQMVLSDIWVLKGDLQYLISVEADKDKKEKLNSILSTLESIEEAVSF
jgi:hypothetical protein